MVQEYAFQGLMVNDNPGAGDQNLCDEKQGWKKIEHSQLQKGKLWWAKGPGNKIILYNGNLEEALGTLKPNDWDPVSHIRQNGFEVETSSHKRKRSGIKTGVRIISREHETEKRSGSGRISNINKCENEGRIYLENKLIYGICMASEKAARRYPAVT